MVRKSERKSPQRPTPTAAPSTKRPRGRPPKRDSDAGTAAASTTRVIKRYGNRRLYDGRLSRCVTMEEIAGFVQRGEEVRVVDAESGEDITKRILVQIMLETQHQKHLELLPVGLLRMMLSLRNDTLTQWLEQYLHAGSDWLERQIATAAALAPIPGAMTEGASSLEALFPWMKAMQSPPREAAPPPRAPAPPPRAAASDPAAADDLRDEVAELQRRLARLAGRMKRG